MINNDRTTFDHILDAKKTNLLWRARIIQYIRDFFIGHGYLEVETPCIIPGPAPEVHIDAMRVGHGFLHTSPELCMKRLLSAGYPKIFQLCRVFRQGERGERHLPEFTLLEWYRKDMDYMDLMDECEEMIFFVARNMGFGNKIKYLDRVIDLQRPWERISVEDAFKRYATMSMAMALESGCFDEIMAEEIEPHSGLSRPIFLYDYPCALASLARLKENEPGLAERFELYMGGIEMANAFSELTDAHEQEKRFESDRDKRRHLGKTVYTMPEKFLKALNHMPPSAGIALGVDRLIMVFTNTSKIDDVVFFTPEEL